MRIEFRTELIRVNKLPMDKYQAFYLANLDMNICTTWSQLLQSSILPSRGKAR